MPDPFSIITGTIGACDIILCSISAIIKYASEAKVAAKEWDRIADEVDSLHDITAALHKFLEMQRAKGKPFDETVPIAKYVEKCKVFISSLEQDLVRTKRKGALLWPFGRL
jgi:DNA topoisomerase VI subunit B